MILVGTIRGMTSALNQDALNAQTRTRVRVPRGARSMWGSRHGMTTFSGCSFLIDLCFIFARKVISRGCGITHDHFVIFVRQASRFSRNDTKFQS